MNTLRDYNKLHKIISNENGKAFFEMVKNDPELYMFFSINKLYVWYKGLDVCTVGTNGIHSMTDSFKKRAYIINPKLKKEIETAKQKDKFSIYSNNIEKIKDIVCREETKQIERKNQQEIAQKNSKLADFQILGLEFTVPQELVESKPEFDYIAVDTAKKIIYLIEYKCTYSATCNGSSNLKKHYEDMKKMEKHKELIINTVENLWHLEKGNIKSFSDYRTIPAFLFTDFDYEFSTSGKKEKLNALINEMKKASEIVIWNFDKPEDVDFSKEPIPVKYYKTPK